ncbi:hypothetical protein JI739_04595 [Ramlibacter sp. AW1]|uniref:Uncharacterized protein n=1 Tax=Ramlibacter aurantiacus TaxID=2801330 RepID=A0A936ZG40_9BURK|nr:hypothetical protein [Ramlibacter aurantiacus]MBL0419623.1 hypothetical protein [Ramlibacter aurantiacus]
MDRLLVLRLEAVGCRVRAWLNDLPVLQACEGLGACSVPVNEYVLAGGNQLALEVEPGPRPEGKAPRLAFNAASARVQLLLARTGRPVDDTSRRVHEFAWEVKEGDLYPASRVEHRFELPVRFPRWRWLDAPVIDPGAAYAQVTGFVQELATALFRGQPEPLVSASRVRLDEVAVAYQLRPAEVADRLRARVQLLHGTKALRPVMPALGEMQVRSCGGGRMLECLLGDEPALRTEASEDGMRHAWPLRVAIVDGRCHVFR